jgi:hypothetical protein
MRSETQAMHKRDPVVCRHDHAFGQDQRQAGDMWFNAMTSQELLSTHDEFQFMMMHAVLLGMQNSFLLSREGTLDAEFREAITTAIAAVKDLRGMDRYWRQRSGFFHAGFSEYIDSLLARDAVEVTSR